VHSTDIAAGLVGSYPTFSPLPEGELPMATPSGGSFLLHLLTLADLFLLGSGMPCVARTFLSLLRQRQAGSLFCFARVWRHIAVQSYEIIPDSEALFCFFLIICMFFRLVTMRSVLFLTECKANADSAYILYFPCSLRSVSFSANRGEAEKNADF